MVTINEDLREDIEQDVEMDFVETDGLNQLLWETYGSELEEEVREQAREEGFPYIEDLNNLSYAVTINPFGSEERVCEKWIAYLEDVADDQETLNAMTVNSRDRHQFYMDNINDCLLITFEFYETPEEFGERHPSLFINYLSIEMEMAYEESDMKDFVKANAPFMDAHEEKLIEAFSEAGIPYTPENVQKYPYQITDVKLNRTFDDFAETQASKIEETYPNVKTYIEEDFYKELLYLNVVDYRIELSDDVGEDGEEDIPFDFDDLDDSDIRDVILENEDINELKEQIAVDMLSTDEEIDFAMDVDYLWDISLEHPSDTSRFQPVFNEALKNAGIKSKAEFDDLDDISFVYQAFFDDELLIAGGEPYDDAYTLVYELDRESLREQLAEY